MVSEHGELVWSLNKWKKFTGDLAMCETGFHCSIEPYDAFTFVQGEWLAKVEVRGKSLKEKNKEVWSEMRIVKTYKWTKEDSVRLAIYVAEQVLSIFEKKYPEDKRPREAIEAAKKWLKSPSKKTAYAVADAAEVAAHAANEVAHAANAAYAAVEAAHAANEVAHVAVEAAHAAMIKKIQTYFRKIVREKQNGL